MCGMVASSSELPMRTVCPEKGDHRPHGTMTVADHKVPTLTTEYDRNFL